MFIERREFMAFHGLWSREGVPHSGWDIVNVVDLGPNNAITCEMCQSQHNVRYTHIMRHNYYHEDLQVGCVCAERMSNDYVNPRKNIARLKQDLRSRNLEDRRLARFINKYKDNVNANGNIVIPTADANITILRNRYREGLYVLLYKEQKLTDLDSIETALKAAYDIIISQS
jgi:hypothetical protein